MSSGFYAECLEEIAQLIRQGRIPEARAKVDTELAMPYVPSDVLPALQDFDRQLRLLAAENRKPGVGVMSLEEIEEGLSLIHIFSEKTVRNHISNVILKLAVKGRAQAVVELIRCREIEI